MYMIHTKLQFLRIILEICYFPHIKITKLEFNKISNIYLKEIESNILNTNTTCVHISLMLKSAQ